jgi:hypothetical protein
MENQTNITHLTTIRKIMVQRLKNDLILGNVPFREDDESTNLWKRFVFHHCDHWLNNFWSPILEQLQKKPNIKYNDLLKYSKEWIFHRLFDNSGVFPPMIKEIIQDLFKVLDDQRKPQMKPIVFTNLIFLRFIVSWLFVKPPSNVALELLALLSKVVIKIVYNAFCINQSLSQTTNDDEGDIKLKTVSLSLGKSFQIFMKRVSQTFSFAPFDIRRHITTTTMAMSHKENSRLKKFENEMSLEDVMDLLYDHGLHDVIDQFAKLEIRGKQFINLNDKDLKQIGVVRSGHRKRILKLVSLCMKNNVVDVARRFSF